ncbi:MAG: hypothetical protein R3B13_36365 [Polyangiaceae bacterium]
MRRRVKLGLLLAGAIVGYGAGVARLAHHHRAWGGYGWRGYERRAAFERHVADVCTDAALRARQVQRGASSPPALGSDVVE